MGAHVSRWIDAVFDLDADDGAWLSRIGSASRPLLDAGFGVLAYRFDHRAGTARSLTVQGGSPRFGSALLDAYAKLSPKARTRVWSKRPPVATFSDLWSDGMPATEYEPTAAIARTIGFRDLFSVHGTGADGLDLVLAAPMREVTVLGPSAAARWRALAAHLGVALQLRAALAGHARPIDRLEELLEEARGARPKDGSSDAWQDVLTGRRSIVAALGTHDDRVLVSSPMHVRDPRALTQRERDVAARLALGDSDKAIAYDLGIALGTVSSATSAIAHKIGGGSRATALRRLAHGLVALATLSLGDRHFELLGRPAVGDALAGLTPRERRVAELTLEGRSNDSIARALELRPRTIANHLASAFKKLGVRSRRELVAFVARHGAPRN